MKHQTKLNNKSPIERIILLSFPILFSFTLLSALILLNSHASAEEPLTDTKSATVSVNVPSACTMTSSGEDSHTATVMPGVFTGDIGTTTITTTCNNHPGGYAVYAIGYSDSTYGNTNLIHSTDTSTTIPTGTGTSSSNWSMKLAPGTGTESTDIVDTYRDYANVPSSYTKVVNKNSATSPTTGSTVTTTYGTYITPDQQIGTYTGKVKYIMVNPSTADTPIIYQISYDKNTEDEVTNMPDPNPETSESTTEVATISTNVPVREGYNFKGWCSVETSDETCSGTTYNPDGGGTNLNITLDSAGTNNFTLHAIWGEAITYIQDFTKAMCEEQATDASVTVVDKRDNNEYTVRYINNNCWMTQNLRFTGSTLEPATSNVNYTRTMTWRDLTSSYCNSASTSGTAMSNHCYHISDNTEYGVYYNYAGVSAGTITGNSNSTEATQSVCPAGWTLPTNSQQSGITGTDYVSSFSPVYSGDYSGGSLYDVGSRGYWWSSTAYDSTFRYDLLYSSGGLYTDSDGRYHGYSARCVRK